MFHKFLVVEWDWVEDSLNDEELDTFYYLLSKITDDKPECNYYVINTNEPYAGKIKMIMKRGESKVSREEVLSTLKELSELKHDPEVAHSEADEILINYINDPEIEQVFEEVPKWYA